MLTPQDQALSPSIEIHSCMRREEYVLRKRRRISTINTRDASPIVTRSRSNSRPRGARCSDILYAEYKVLFRRNFQDGLCRPRETSGVIEPVPRKKHSICPPYHAAKSYSLLLVYSSPLCLALCSESSSS